MRKIALLLILYVMVNHVQAQMEVGILAGINRSNFSGNVPPEGMYSAQTGILAGVCIDYQFTDLFSLSFQPGFSTGGTQLKFEDRISGTYVDSLSILSQSVDIPLLFKINSINEKIYFLGGLTYSMLLSMKSDNGITEEDIIDEILNYNIIMNFAIGFNIPVKNSKMFVELRYGQGISNLTDSQDAKSLLPRVKSSAASLVTGWKIGVRKAK